MTVSTFLAILRRIKRKDQPRVNISLFVFGEYDRVPVRIIQGEK